MYRLGECTQSRNGPQPLSNFFTVYLKDSLLVIAVYTLGEANDDLADAEVRFGFSTQRQHLDTKRKGHCEALKEHEARGVGSTGGGSVGTSIEKESGRTIAGGKPFTSKIVWFTVFDDLELAVVVDARFSRKVRRDTATRGTSLMDINAIICRGYFCACTLVMASIFARIPAR